MLDPRSDGGPRRPIRGNPNRGGRAKQSARGAGGAEDGLAKVRSPAFSLNFDREPAR